MIGYKVEVMHMGMSIKDAERLRSRPEPGTPAWYKQLEQESVKKPAESKDKPERKEDRRTVQQILHDERFID